MLRLIFNFILIVISFVAFRFIFTPRYSLKIQLVSHLIAIPLLCAISLAMEEMSVLRLFVGLVFLMMYGIILFRNKWYSISAAVLGMLAIDMLMEVFMILAFPAVKDYGVDSLPIGVQILTDVLYIFFVAVALLFIVVFFRRKKGFGIDVLTGRDTLIFAFFPLSQLIALINIIYDISMDPSAGEIVRICLTVNIFLISDVLLFILIRRTAYNAELRMQNKTLVEQVETTKNYYRELTEQHETVRRMRHDIENHMYTINILLEEGKIDEASQYADELRKRQTDDFGLFSCKNSVVSSFLYARFKDAAAEGHRVNAKINLAECNAIENVDLICAFGNMLDNALEACRVIPDSCIDLNCYSKNGYLYIETGNPYVPKQKKLRRIPELQRGIGTRILNSIADKYDGVFCTKEEDGRYEVSLIMKENKSVADSSM